jgi:uncharacterized protein (TIGR02271 family)
MVTKEQAQTLVGSSGNVLSTTGDKIGGIGQIYVDDSTGQPTWVTVKTGLFGTSESFVPLDSASVAGDDIRVGYDKDTVKDAPRVDADGDITPEEENKLYSYYGISDSGSAYNDVDRDIDVDRGTDVDRDSSVTTGTTAGLSSGDSDAEFTGDRTDSVGHDTSGPTTDTAMTLSEEQLRVGTQTREAGRARLRKYVVTENVTQTIPVSREEVRIEREPITDANRGAAEAGPAISEEEHEVILHEERPVVEKEAVPTERVRLDTETVTEQATVSEEVRKEEIATDVDGDRTR